SWEKAEETVSSKVQTTKSTDNFFTNVEVFIISPCLFLLRLVSAYQRSKRWSIKHAKLKAFKNLRLRMGRMGELTVRIYQTWRILFRPNFFTTSATLRICFVETSNRRGPSVVPFDPVVLACLVLVTP